MPTIKRYLFEDLLSGTAAVTAVFLDGEPRIRLDQTWFHPQGGGQKADRGRIAGIPVLHAAKAEGEVDHFVADASVFFVGQEVPVEVDAGGREANSLLHSGGHLIASVGHDRFPVLTAVSGHHWPGEARVEFEGDLTSDLEGFRLALGEGLAQAVSGQLPIRVVGDPLSARTIKIGEFDAIPCGGTHVAHTELLRTLEITGVKTKSGRLRVGYRIGPLP